MLIPVSNKDAIEVAMNYKKSAGAFGRQCNKRELK